jgi:hypothetical protein
MALACSKGIWQDLGWAKSNTELIHQGSANNRVVVGLHSHPPAYPLTPLDGQRTEACEVRCSMDAMDSIASRRQSAQPAKPFTTTNSFTRSMLPFFAARHQIPNSFSFLQILQKLPLTTSSPQPTVLQIAGKPILFICVYGT